MPPKQAKNPNGKNPDKTSPIEYPCIVCNLEAKEKAIRCDLCKFWCHNVCADIDKETVDKYIKNKKLHWFCPSCEPHAASLLDRIKVLEGNHDKMYKDTKSSIKNHATSTDQQLATLRNEIQTKEDNLYKKIAEVRKTLTTPIDTPAPPNANVDLEKIKDELIAHINTVLSTKLGDQTNPSNEAAQLESNSNSVLLDARIEELQTSINELKNPQPNLAPTPSVTDTERIREVLEEKERIDKKKCNLIFSNIEESNSIQEDEDRVNRIIKEKLNIREEVHITTVARLGKRIEESNRLVKVVFETLNMKKLVLRNATRMRQLDEDDPDHLVYIRPDLTKLQVEASKNLTAELMRIRENNPGKWVIRRGKIINLDDPENQSA